ncbi:PorT family protein [Spirosoma sp. HMF4905]|uniref:PorT family protein n=1 Tax=Spirosoma arboris TaxID=2682092 RepID=A0A7K1SER4_9BACT|nr:PorT family protein [Spirosoma arboris]MVM32292.1 PorT family protein [Spirosoma arboris]
MMIVTSAPRWLTGVVAWFGCLFVLMSLPGCSPEFVQASADARRDGFRGPSYDGIETPILFGTNVNAYWTGQFARTAGIGSKYQVNPATLLAANTNQPGPMAPDPKLTSFLSHVSFLYGGQLIGKGGKYTDNFGTGTSRRTYLEAISYALYNYDLPNDKGRIFGGLGPFLGLGLFGTSKYENARFGTQSYGAFDKNAGYSRLDGGLAFTAGYQLPQGLRLSIAHELGLVNIDPVSGGSADKTFTRVWSLNVAYPTKKLVALVKKK